MDIITLNTADAIYRDEAADIQRVAEIGRFNHEHDAIDPVIISPAAPGADTRHQSGSWFDHILSPTASARAAH
jgi:hypothetical protein